MEPREREREREGGRPALGCWRWLGISSFHHMLMLFSVMHGNFIMLVIVMH